MSIRDYLLVEKSDLILILQNVTKSCEIVREEGDIFHLLPK